MEPEDALKVLPPLAQEDKLELLSYYRSMRVSPASFSGMVRTWAGSLWVQLPSGRIAQIKPASRRAAPGRAALEVAIGYFGDPPVKMPTEVSSVEALVGSGILGYGIIDDLTFEEHLRDVESEYNMPEDYRKLTQDFRDMLDSLRGKMQARFAKNQAAIDESTVSRIGAEESLLKSEEITVRAERTLNESRDLVPFK
jgi:hypothetical protein